MAMKRCGHQFWDENRKEWVVTARRKGYYAVRCIVGDQIGKQLVLHKHTVRRRRWKNVPNGYNRRIVGVGLGIQKWMTKRCVCGALWVEWPDDVDYLCPFCRLEEEAQAM